MDGGGVTGKEDILCRVALHLETLGLGTFFGEAVGDAARTTEAFTRLAGQPVGPCWCEDAAAAGLRRKTVESFIAGGGITGFKAVMSPFAMEPDTTS